MGAGSMLVAFLVCADGKFGDVRAHGLTGEVELHVGAALAALAVVRQANRMGVRDKISRHEESAGDLAIAAEEIVLGRIETIEKRVIVVENKIDVVDHVDDE